MTKENGAHLSTEANASAAPSHVEDAGSPRESTYEPISALPSDADHLLADPRGFREAAARVTAILVRHHGPEQLDPIEDAVQDAFAAAARSWPVAGAPRDAIAWLTQVARRRYLDRLRGTKRLVHDAGALDAAVSASRADDTATLEAVPLADDQLRLLFLCCHPALSAESRVALTLKCVAQFSVSEIARLLRADAPAVAQRLVRAKRTLRDTRATFVVPTPSALPERLSDVHAVCYAIFAEGHLATHGEMLVRPELCREAIHLVQQLLRWPATDTPAGRALLALMLLTAARLPARDTDGAPVPLGEQDRTRWDRALIARGMRLFAASAEGSSLTRYHVEADIAAAHATANHYADTPWPRIVNAYDLLRRIAPSPMVELARAMAIAESGDNADALAVVNAMPTAMQRWPEWHATLATLLMRVGRNEEATPHWEAAISGTESLPVREHYERRLRVARGRV
jgi:RNA polymerase sigma-70 factor (ECF subfamily)